MFTGIVERTAQVRAIEPTQGDIVRLTLSAGATSPPDQLGERFPDLVLGESIAVNGCCLTLVVEDSDSLAFDVVQETLRVTTLGDLAVGDHVNLERSLRVGDRLGGHYVTGHVDAIGEITRFDRGEEIILGVTVRKTVDRFATIVKGSVAIDGISLTVVDSAEEEFTVALIPHTLEVTHLDDSQVGDRVNLEMDHIGKWVDHLLAARAIDRKD